jgi:hypothetical protein
MRANHGAVLDDNRILRKSSIHTLFGMIVPLRANCGMSPNHYPVANLNTASTPHMNKRANSNIATNFHIVSSVDTNWHIHGNFLSTGFEAGDQMSTLRILKNDG